MTARVVEEDRVVESRWTALMVWSQMLVGVENRSVPRRRDCGWVRRGRAWVRRELRPLGVIKNCGGCSYASRDLANESENDAGRRGKRPRRRSRTSRASTR